MLTADLSRLSSSELAHFGIQTGLGAKRLEHPFVQRTFAGLLKAADDEATRRIAGRVTFPHRVDLPIDPDADPLNALSALHALMAVTVGLRDAAGAAEPVLTALWGDLTAQLAALCDERRGHAGELATLLGSPPHV